MVLKLSLIHIFAQMTPNCKYTIGSVLSHVTLHQTIIGLEAEKQMEMADVYKRQTPIGSTKANSEFAFWEF